MFACLNLQKIMMFLCAMVSLTMLSFLILPYLVFTCNFSLDLCQQPIQEVDFQVNAKQLPPNIIKNIDYNNNENITAALALEAPNYPDDLNDEIKSSISSTVSKCKFFPREKISQKVNCVYFFIIISALSYR